MNADVTVGIDPGKNGGIAVFKNGRVHHCLKNGDGQTIYRAILNAASLNGNAYPIVGIESVPKWCGEERFAAHAMTGSAMATMFGNYKLAVGVCIGLGIDPVLLVPVKWQNLVECRNRERLETTDWKNKLKRRAAQLHPEFNGLTLWNSDAILIAHATELFVRELAV